MTLMPEPVLPRTYPHKHVDDWTDDDWRRIPQTLLPTRTLIPSQEGLSLTALARIVNGGPAEGGDTAGRVIRYAGRDNLHDGHHRWVLALLRGEAWFPVRVVEGGPS